MGSRMVCNCAGKQPAQWYTILLPIHREPVLATAPEPPTRLTADYCIGLESHPSLYFGLTVAARCCCCWCCCQALQASLPKPKLTCVFTKPPVVSHLWKGMQRLRSTTSSR